MKTILLVEDDKFTIEYLSAILEPAGYQVIACANEFRGLDLISEGHDIDLVLSDINMTFNNSGFELLRNMKIMASKKRLPFIFITGLRSANTISEAIKLGADGIVMKPIEPEKLLNQIEQVLNRAGLLAASELTQGAKLA